MSEYISSYGFIKQPGIVEFDVDSTCENVIKSKIFPFEFKEITTNWEIIQFLTNSSISTKIQFL